MEPTPGTSSWLAFPFYLLLADRRIRSECQGFQYFENEIPEHPCSCLRHPELTSSPITTRSTHNLFGTRHWYQTTKQWLTVLALVLVPPIAVPLLRVTNSTHLRTKVMVAVMLNSLQLTMLLPPLRPKIQMAVLEMRLNSTLEILIMVGS
jgi:hypothetical protein